MKREGPDDFGLPEVFVVRKGGHGFAWELRRFGGVVLQHGPEACCDLAAARADGEKALAVLLATADLPAIKRDENG